MTVLLYGPLLCGCNVAIKGLMSECQTEIVNKVNLSRLNVHHQSVSKRFVFISMGLWSEGQYPVQYMERTPLGIFPPDITALVG